MNRTVGTMLMLVATIAGLVAGSYWAHWRLTRWSDVRTLRIERLEVVGTDGTPHVVIGASDSSGWVQCLSAEKDAPIATLEATESTARLVVASRHDARTLESRD